MKCIFNPTTGKPLAYVHYDEDLEAMMKNWPTADSISVEAAPPKDEYYKYSVDLTTRQLVKSE
jgi:hypothetical protein